LAEYVRVAAHAVYRGADVYAFLFGIVALGEIAGFEGLFDWIAARLARLARGSGYGLFSLFFVLGVGVTALLSNDTTAVMLTPAVLASVTAVRVPALPSLYACAFVANAASFVLPISNPANLVVFDGHLPRLGPWLTSFAMPSLVALGVTFAVLSVLFRRELGARYEPPLQLPRITRAGTVAAIALGLSAVGLIVAAASGVNVGYTALVAAIVSTAVVAFADARVAVFVVRNLAWKIVAFVAALFAFVSILDRLGAIDVVRALIVRCEGLGSLGGLMLGTAATLASSTVNNLPVALTAGVALQSEQVSPWIARAALVSVDLGPNLALSGSLATLIWISHLRRAGIALRWWEFLRVGAAVTAPSLALSLLLLR
jgi:arsenical pump membrane protein